MPDCGARPVRRVPGPLGWRMRRLGRWVAADLAARLIQCAARIGWLRRLPRALLIPAERCLIATRGTDLFDRQFYLDHHSDVRAAGADPLGHYLRHGWREGRAPNPYFDDGHYRAEAGLVRGAPISALGHYLAFGRRHGLCPVPGVDLGAYGVRHPGIAVARLDAYAQLLRRADPPDDGRPDLAAVLAGLAACRKRAGAAHVDVIVPVYLGRAETLNTLLHVLTARGRIRPNLVVVDDATPDRALAGDLRDLAARGLIELVVHTENRGFVAAVNTGMGRHPDRDVVWLNADTEVYDHWLDRLARAAYRGSRTATVTPLTNNGTICSYPRFNADNPGLLETGWDEIDRLAARFNAGQLVETPTAVGFATYVRRAALREIGPLDEGAFGHGYGEENDFSQRAVAAGWRNVVAADVVVRHFGATSFQSSRAARVERALKVLDRRHPRYRAAVQEFLAADPLAALRRRLDLARLSRLSGPRNVLIVTHARGGGTEQHVQEEIARLRADGASVYLLRPSGAGRVALGHADVASVPALSGLGLGDEALWSALAVLRISEAHIHHLIDLDRAAPAILADRLGRLGIPLEVVVHDYFAICPRVNMADLGGRYCGEPGPRACQGCLERRGSPAGRPEIGAWRAGHLRLLAAARRVRVPDGDVARRLARYFPGLANIRVRPHEPVLPAPARPLPPRRPGPPRIAVIGAIGPIKGFDVLLGLAGHLARARIAAELTVIGHTRDDAAARQAGITVTGPYLNAEADRLVAEADPDLIWIPSTWPETYCYTLSIALRSGRPVAGFEIGAVASRLRAAGRGTLVNLALADDPRGLWQALAAAARTEEVLELAS